MKKQLLFILLLTTTGISTSFCQAGPEKQIRKILQEQTAAWNRGDIDAFMKGYWVKTDLHTVIPIHSTTTKKTIPIKIIWAS